MRHVSRIGSLLWQTTLRWIDHDAPRIGAALAFYTLLAFPPLVQLSITAGSLLFKGTRTELLVVQQVSDLGGDEAAKLAKQIIERPHTASSGLAASLLGLATLLIGASGIFAELRGALNSMWEIRPKEGGGFLQWVRSRLLSVGMVFAGGFLLMASLVVSTMLAALGTYVDGILPAPAPLLEAMNFIISLAGSAAMFALILRYIPDRRLPWRTISSGALVTAFLFTVGKSLIGLYLGRSAIGSQYGAGGSVVIVIAWVYYSAQIFLFGAEFTQTLASGAAPPTAAKAAHS